MSQICRIQVNELLKLDCRVEDDLPLKPNDWCVYSTDRYEDIGRVIGRRQPRPEDDLATMAVAQRQANLSEQSKVNENRARSKRLRQQAADLVKQHDLPMKIVLAHLTYDRGLVLVIFTAPGRVDFRDLLKDLRSSYDARVELRQVGPRDQAAMVGGLGSCGRELCCSAFLTNFVSINVKMAKIQGLSLNPSSIMGACGRLKCCLDYEYEAYRDLVRGMPRVGTPCTCDGCDGHVIDANPLTQTVKVELEDRRIVTVPVAELQTRRA